MRLIPQQVLIMPAFLCAVSFGGTISLSSPSFSGYCFTNGNTAGPCTQNNVLLGGGPGVASASSAYGLSGVTGPYVTASASDSGGGNPAGHASLTYQMYISGPGSSTQIGSVQVDVNYLDTLTGSFSPSPVGAFQNASLGVNSGFTVYNNTTIINSNNPIIKVLSTGANCCFPASFTDSSLGATYNAATNTWTAIAQGPTVVTLPTNTVINVTFFVDAECQASTSESCSVSATLDPTFTFDPGQANANQYSLQFSAGVGNGLPTSTPEPNTAVLLVGTGLAGWGLMRRRK